MLSGFWYNWHDHFQQESLDFKNSQSCLLFSAALYTHPFIQSDFFPYKYSLLEKYILNSSNVQLINTSRVRDTKITSKGTKPLPFSLKMTRILNNFCLCKSLSPALWHRALCAPLNVLIHTWLSQLAQSSLQHRAGMWQPRLWSVLLNSGLQKPSLVIKLIYRLTSASGENRAACCQVLSCYQTVWT